MSPALRSRLPYLGLLLAVFSLDQVTKRIVDGALEVHESHPLVSGLLSLTYVRNRGAAFGILSDADLPFQPAVFAAVSVVALVLIVVYALRTPAGHRLPQTALALITGGALGNLADRARLGYVIDFIDAYWGPHHWPAFNVADSAISVGVGLLVLDLLRSPGPEGEAAGPVGAEPARAE